VPSSSSSSSSSAAPLRVAIVNDYEIIVIGVANMLSSHRDRVEVVELDNQVPVASDVDVILFDTFADVPGGAMSLGDVIKVDGPKVVVYTWSTDPTAVRQALAQGAAGYLSKTLPPLDLVQALEDIHSGAVVTSDTYEVLLGQESEDSPAHGVALSSREAEVMALIATGLSNEEIGRALFLSVNSIKTYIRTAYAKIGVHSRSQAVLWAVKHGFVRQSQRTIEPGPKA
jgi:NarL family two-component system response regulator LiaR